MAITNTTYRVYVEKLGDVDPSTFVGNEGEVFYDPDAASPTLRLSDGSTAGGIAIGGTGGGGSGISSVFEDTTPRLGGNLDVNGQTITDSVGGFAGGIVRVGPTIDINSNRVFYRPGTDSGLNIRSDNTSNNIYLYSYGDGNGVGVGNVYITATGVDIYSNWQEGGAGEKKWAFDQNGTLTTPDNKVIVGGATTELIVNGDARITGILTIGTSSITLNGNTNEIRIGTAATISESGAANFSDINVTGISTFGGPNNILTTIEDGYISVGQAETIDIAGGNTNLTGETAGRARLVGGSNTFIGSGGGGGGGTVIADRGDSQFGGDVILAAGSGFDDGDGGDVRLSPGIINGTSITGKKGRVEVTRGGFRVAVYANTAARDVGIDAPLEGDICFVSNVGLQVYDTTNQWVTLQGVA